MKKTKARQGSLSFFGHRSRNVSLLKLICNILCDSYFNVEKLQRREDGSIGSALAIWLEKHQDAKGSWTTDFAKTQYVS